LQRWFDWLVQKQAPQCIDALGESMGAAQLLNSLKTVRGFFSGNFSKVWRYRVIRFSE